MEEDGYGALSNDRMGEVGLAKRDVNEVLPTAQCASAPSWLAVN